jgi:hypothetical protein
MTEELGYEKRQKRKEQRETAKTAPAMRSKVVLRPINLCTVTKIT